VRLTGAAVKVAEPEEMDEGAFPAGQQRNDQIRRQPKGGQQFHAVEQGQAPTPITNQRQPAATAITI